MQRVFIIIIACLISLSCLSQESKRLALVVGNANYEKGELKNPVNDALLVAETLEAVGFDVILKTDIPSKDLFIKAIREFGDRKVHYNVGFIYYAGHGIQVDGDNYLLPTKASFNSEDDVYFNAINVKEILRFLNSRDGDVNVLVLDACRNNPFERSWSLSRDSNAAGKGLAKIPPPSGSFIAFSTDEGRTAADGVGNNSLYCESLCQHILEEGLTLEQVFKRVRTDVEDETDGVQSPIEMQKLRGEDFYFIKSYQNNALTQNAESLNEESCAVYAVCIHIHGD